MSSPGKSLSGRRLSRMKSKKQQFLQQRVALLWGGDPTLTVLMWGVSHTINDLLQLPPPVMLLPDDFKASVKMKVNNHFYNKENLPGHFTFKEYCPLVFRNLRERFGVEHQQYQVSLTHSPPLKDDTLMFSYDHTLVLKQISSEEVEEIHSILSEYHQHIVTCAGASLLPQFLGLYRVSVESEHSYLLVMRSVFSHTLAPHRKYQLKGSLVSREASDKEKGKDSPTLKDVEFRRNRECVHISEEQTEELMEKLQRDVEFLVRLKVMDYSLLLGIHEVRSEEEDEDEDKGEDEEQQESVCSAAERFSGFTRSSKTLDHGEFDPSVDVYGIPSAEGAPRREVYFLGLMSVLTQYDSRKRAVHAAKTVKHGAGAEISTVHPEQYAKRFLEFVSSIFRY